MEKKRLQQGVFDELFELYYDKLTVFVYSYINDAEAAMDIVNDLFLNLWKDRTQFSPIPTATAKWYPCQTSAAKSSW